MSTPAVLRDLDQVSSLYQQLTALVPRARRAATTNRATEGSEPIAVAVVDHMVALETYLAQWIHHARWLLDPQPRILLGVACPYCSSALMAWPNKGVIACASLPAVHPESVGPRRWVDEAEWYRLGMLTGQRPPASGRARPPWERLAEAVVAQRESS